MDVQRAKELVELLEDVIGRFGSQGAEGYCCEHVSYIEYRALRLLAKGEAPTVHSLGQQLGLTKSGATRIVDRLEKRGYARRERDRDDQRVCCVTLTEAGRGLVERIFEQFAAEVRLSVSRLDEDMGDVLVASLRSFVRTFRA
jgi:DNA-binding MarR family transcriptional regulator